ncbi:hypothetical protein NPIL_664111 [Nephila pilipes]|uniref:Uncharacterized protein n=1 Tax=Nephila pilipes TaxID=299642 RepID=A0A8X6TK27_NEPPI|nr:hypothetical protein NPIL_664111 [Nephila pilipes]
MQKGFLSLDDDKCVTHWYCGATMICSAPGDWGHLKNLIRTSSALPVETFVMYPLLTFNTVTVMATNWVAQFSFCEVMGIGAN